MQGKQNHGYDQQDQYEPNEEQIQIAQQIAKYGYQDYSQSREQLKEQIAGYFPAHGIQLSAHQSFDISSFAESKNPSDFPIKHLRQNFPHSNAPTLNVDANKPNILIRDHSQQHLHVKNNKKQASKEKGQITARNNDQIKYQVNTRIKELEQQNVQLKRGLQEKQEEFNQFLQKIRRLNEQNLHIQQSNKEKDLVIADLRDKIKGFKVKYHEISQQLSIVNNSRRNSQYCSHNNSQNQSRKQNRNSQDLLMASESHLDFFSPELMSPEQCEKLFEKLVLKLDKSHKIRRRIGKSEKVREILMKILKQE